jgi:hypothetical protein
MGIFIKDVDKIFWIKHEKIMDRMKKKIDNEYYRVSNFKQ